jgi:hypothetical protein
LVPGFSLEQAPYVLIAGAAAPAQMDCAKPS